MNQPFEWRNAPQADYAVIGQDVSHSLSPAMHNQAFEAVRLPLRYTAVNVGEGESEAALDHLAELGYNGVNVTFPHKEAAARWASTLDPSAVAAGGVVNTLLLRDKRGFNTDAAGFEESLDWSRFRPGDRCLLLGAGGAARAVLSVLKKRGLKTFGWNRTRSRAQSLLEIDPALSLQDDPAANGCKLIINATSSGKTGAEVPIDWRGVEQGALAYDLFYSANPTAFLTEAASHGLETMDGVRMLVLQGAKSWKCWEIGAEPPVEVMEHAVRENLAKRS